MSERMKRKRLRRLLCVLIKCYMNTHTISLQSECTKYMCVFRPSNFLVLFSCDMPAGPYIYTYAHRIYLQVSHFSNNKMPVFYILYWIVSVRQATISARPSHSWARSVLFPSGVLSSWKGIRQGPPAHLKKRPKSSARVLRRGCGAEGRRRCCVFVCASAECSQAAWQPVVPEISMWARVLFLTASSLCAAECRVSSRAVLEEGRRQQARLFASLGAKCSDILTAEFPTREKVNRSRLTFAVLFYFLFGFWGRNS